MAQLLPCKHLTVHYAKPSAEKRCTARALRSVLSTNGLAFISKLAPIATQIPSPSTTCSFRGWHGSGRHGVCLLPFGQGLRNRKLRNQEEGQCTAIRPIHPRPPHPARLVAVAMLVPPVDALPCLSTGGDHVSCVTTKYLKGLCARERSRGGTCTFCTICTPVFGPVSKIKTTNYTSQNTMYNVQYIIDTQRGALSSWSQNGDNRNTNYTSQNTMYSVHATKSTKRLYFAHNSSLNIRSYSQMA